MFFFTSISQFVSLIFHTDSLYYTIWGNNIQPENSFWQSFQ